MGEGYRLERGEGDGIQKREKMGMQRDFFYPSYVVGLWLNCSQTMIPEPFTETIQFGSKGSKH